MARMKYVVVRVNEGVDYPFMFPAAIDHDIFADMARHSVVDTIQRRRGRSWKTEIISAGFIFMLKVPVSPPSTTPGLYKLEFEHGSETLDITPSKERLELDRKLFEEYWKSAYKEITE